MCLRLCVGCLVCVCVCVWTGTLDGQPAVTTNQLQYIKNEVLPPLFKHRDAWPFVKPVRVSWGVL